MAYKNYVADTLRMIARGGLAPTVRFAEIINPKPQDSRSGDEIAAEIIERCGLVVV